MKCKKKKLGGRKSLLFRGTVCLNCGHPLDKSDVFCPQCSQLNSTKYLAITDFFMEFLSSILVYDSRLRNTIKDLLFKPGLMTLNFTKGQRLKYANPFRFFLSVSLIYILLNGILNWVTNSENRNIFSLNVKVSDTRMDSLLEIDSIETLFYNKKDSLVAQKLGTPYYFSEPVLDSLPFWKKNEAKFKLYLYYYQKHQTDDINSALKQLNHSQNYSNHWLYARARSAYKIIYDPTSFINYVIPKVPFFLFFFSPFFAFFFWLLYSKKRHTYVDHLIFVFHIFSFVFLALIIFIIPDFFLNNFFTLLLFYLIGPVYFFLALRKFYGQGKLKTFLKFVILSIVFNIGFFIATLFFVAGSVAIY